MNTHRKGIIAFLLIAFGMAWTIWEIVIRRGVPVNTPVFSAASFPAAFAPAVAAFVVRKWVTREGFADAGLRLKLRNWPYYLFAWLFPLVLVGCIVALAPLLGVGRADFSLVRGTHYLISTGAHSRMVQHLWSVIPLLLVEAICLTPISWGEEFGWRGYLQLRLFHGRPVLSAIVTGLIWGIWHYPALLRGYDFPDNRVAGPLVFTVTTVLFSIILGWLRLKTGSIWPCSLAHAAMNAIGASLTVLLFGGGASLLLVFDLGVLGWIPLGALCAWIVFTGQFRPAETIASEKQLGRAAQAP